MRASERHHGALQVHVGGAADDTLFSAAHCRLGALYVDLFGTLCGVREYRNPVRKDFKEASAHRHVILFAILVNANLARLQRGQQRSVVGQDAKLPVDSGGDEHIDILGIYHPLGGYYFKSHCSHFQPLPGDGILTPILTLPPIKE